MFRQLDLEVYVVNGGVNDANVDESLATGGPLTPRNSHLIMTEDYDLVAAEHLAASATRARFNVPTWNALARSQIWGVNRSATQPSNPNIMDFRADPLQIPRVEEIAIEESNNLGAATERTQTVILLAERGWKPQGIRGKALDNFDDASMIVRATSAIAVVANAWSGLGTITFSENLRGGWYAVIGAEVIWASGIAFRLFFPRSPYGSGGRQLRPGGLCSNALGDVPWRPQLYNCGPWGLFHSFEPPQIEFLGLTAAAASQEIRLNLVWLGEGDQGVVPAYSLVPAIYPSY